MQSYMFEPWPEEGLTKEAAQELLAPFADAFNCVWREAWDDVIREVSDDLRSRLRPTTRAGVIHDAAVARASLLFAGDNRVEVCRELGFFKLYIDDIAVIRLKRVDWCHLARNIKTQQQRRWYYHQPIDGVRKGRTRLTVGYVLNVAETAIDRIVASYQWGLKDLIYSFYLDAESGAQPTITPIPVQPLTPETKPAVRAKGAKEGKKAQE